MAKVLQPRLADLTWLQSTCALAWARRICLKIADLLVFCSKKNYEEHLWLEGSRKWPFGRCKKPTETLTHQTHFQFVWLPVSSCPFLFFFPLQTSTDHLFQVSCFTCLPSIRFLCKALLIFFFVLFFFFPTFLLAMHVPSPATSCKHYKL